MSGEWSTYVPGSGHATDQQDRPVDDSAWPSRRPAPAVGQVVRAVVEPPEVTAEEAWLDSIVGLDD